MSEETRGPVLLPALPIALLTLTVVVGFGINNVQDGMLVAAVLAGLLLSKEVIDVSGSPVPRWVGSSLTAIIVPLVLVFIFNIVVMLFE